MQERVLPPINPKIHQSIYPLILSLVLGFELCLRLNYNHGVPEEHPIDASTRICAVYGLPVRHSASPAMQNAGIAALGLNWRYIACEVAPETLRSAIEGAAVLSGWISVSSFAIRKYDWNASSAA